jgi:hypothetical protein
MKLYPEGYEGTKMSDEQRGQYVEQKEVKKTNKSVVLINGNFV